MPVTPALTAPDIQAQALPDTLVPLAQHTRNRPMPPQVVRMVASYSPAETPTVQYDQDIQPPLLPFILPSSNQIRFLPQQLRYILGCSLRTLSMVAVRIMPACRPGFEQYLILHRLQQSTLQQQTYPAQQ